MTTIEVGVCFKYDQNEKRGEFVFLDPSCHPASLFVATESPATFLLKKGLVPCPEADCGQDFDFRSLSLALNHLSGCTVTADMMQEDGFTIPTESGLVIKFTQFETDCVSFRVDFQATTSIDMVVTLEATAAAAGLPLFSSKDPQIVLQPQP